MTSKTLNHDLEILERQYAEIEIPFEIDEAISLGLERGEKLRLKNKVKHWSAYVAACLLIAISSLTVAVNVSPSFAQALSEVPVLGRVVEILQFVDGQAEGGQRTDGTDISSMQVLKSGETESFIIHFNQGGAGQSDAPAYNIEVFENPHVLQFDVGGARMISAQEDFTAIKDLSSVKDIYRLMTLDDSLIRFNIVFEGPVEVQVTEIAEPAGLSVSVKPLSSERPEPNVLYTVRSHSYVYSETFGHLEEELFRLDLEGKLDTYRILKDSKDQFVLELGQFESKQAAEAFLEQFTGTLSFELIIEEREGRELPKNLSE